MSERHLRGGPARGPKGLAGDGPEDRTFTPWGDVLTTAGEHRRGLADAEADAAYRWMAPVVRDRDVLDVGCGPGHGASVLLGAGARSFVGVDPDSRAVEMATRLYGAGARFLHAEPMALPLAPRSFDVVCCFGALETARDADAVLAGIRRTLTDHGLLLASLPVGAEGQPSDNGAEQVHTRESWREVLLESFRNVRLYRRRLCVAAAVGPADEPAGVPVERIHWLGGGEGEDRATLAIASHSALPELAPVASLSDSRDLREYRLTLAAWEERARRAEADGSAKHWELVAAREAQRRLRKRVHELEHRPLRVLWRVLRGRPARVGQGPPIRASERSLDRWD